MLTPLSDEAILDARLKSTGSDNLAQWRAVARKAEQERLRQVVELFESGGIYVINTDGVYFWSPHKFRKFWRELKEQAEVNDENNTTE